MKRAWIPAVAVCAVAACTPADTHPLADRTWEIIAVYTDPDMPGDVPADAAGRAALTFGRNSLTARTACAPLQARASVAADSVRLERVKVGSLDDACAGGSRRLHEQLVGLLVEGAEFDVRHVGETEGEPKEIMLTLRSDAIDPPTIRAVTP